MMLAKILHKIDYANFSFIFNSIALWDRSVKADDQVGVISISLPVTTKLKPVAAVSRLSRRRFEDDLPTLRLLGAFQPRARNNLNIPVECREKRHQSFDGVFAEISLKQP